jgi:RNA polymerase sigma-70 factor (ECF subfamily)
MDEQDQQLLNMLNREFDHSFKHLVMRYQDMLYAFSCRLAHKTQDAEDIVQEAFLSAYIALSQYPPAQIRTLQLRAWLYKVTLNIFRNNQRDLRLLVTSLDTAEQASSLDVPDRESERPDFLYENAERAHTIKAALETLPEHYRVVVICFYFEEMSYQEMSDLLDLPSGTIKSRLHRGLQLLRKNFQEQERSTAHGI